MKTTIGIILILASVVLGYVGIKGLQTSGESVKILGLQISAEDENAKATAYVELGAAALCLIGGIVLVSRKEGK